MRNLRSEDLDQIQLFFTCLHRTKSLARGENEPKSPSRSCILHIPLHQKTIASTPDILQVVKK